MNLRTVTQLAVALAAFAAVSPAVAQNYDTRIYNVSVGAEPIEQATPSFPSGLRIGQEGWVSINYVITADGQAIDPVILDSVGGIGFEQSAREALLEWRFEAPGDSCDATAAFSSTCITRRMPMPASR
ncbi:MAG: energy transducer TonB [Woeseiaceae bacterium]